jgi:hypothetical protein
MTATATVAPPPDPALLEELRQLVRMAALRPELTLDLGPPGCGWSFNWTQAHVQICPVDVATRAPDFCRGLVLHEAAHAAVTRLERLMPLDALRERMPLLNTIEDCRIETWLRERFPGSPPWIRAYNDALFGEMRASPQPRSRQSQFCRALLERWWFGDASAGLHPVVETALTETAAAVARAIDCQPPVDTSLTGAIQNAQRDMWRVVEADVLPAWERLAALDRADGLHDVALEELARLLERLGAAGHLTPEAGDGAPRSLPRPGSGAGTSASRASAKRAISRSLGTDGRDAWLSGWMKVEGLTDHVSDELLRVLQPRRRMRWTRGHPWGMRLDLRRAMQFSADPRQSETLWMRAVLPERREPEIALLIDRSSSMRSEGRMLRAFEALVLLVEATRRAGVPASVWSFSNDVREELASDATLEPQTRAALGGLREATEGGTDLAGALAAVAESFAASRAGQKLLFVLSDGEPNDRDAAARAVDALEEAGVSCVGLGLGAGTGSLRTLFRTSVVEVPVEAVAARIGDLLMQAFSDGPRGSRRAG